MKKYHTIIILVAIFGKLFSQEDTTSFNRANEEDTLYFENKPNYLGVNITPFFTSIMGRENNDIKMFLIYKRNLGDKNLRISANYSTMANRSQFTSNTIINTTDSSYNGRFFNNGHKNYDIRIGFEEIKGYQYSRLHIGADVLFGLGKYQYNYFERAFMLDSNQIYRLQSNMDMPDGKISGNYFNIGLCVSFGFDWFISDDFLFTFQLTPQFVYHRLLNFNKEDNYGVYSSLNSFTDFKLGFFDVMMVYRF